MRYWPLLFALVLAGGAAPAGAGKITIEYEITIGTANFPSGPVALHGGNWKVTFSAIGTYTPVAGPATVDHFSAIGGYSYPVTGMVGGQGQLQLYFLNLLTSPVYGLGTAGSSFINTGPGLFSGQYDLHCYDTAGPATACSSNGYTASVTFAYPFTAMVAANYFKVQPTGVYGHASITGSYVSASGSGFFSMGVQGMEVNRTFVGPDFQVNSYTTSDQNRPSVSLDADGDFVVVWHSYGSAGSDTSSSSIQGQRCNATGSAIGSEFQVNTYTTSSQSRPSVSLDADGDFVVVWQSAGSAGSDTEGYSIQGQRYDASGNTVGGEFQVNTYTTSSQSRPSVSLDADGDFVVVWHSYGSAGSDTSNSSIQGQRYDASGNTVGGEFQVNTYTAAGQEFPSVSLDADGDFVVVWDSYGSAGSDNSSRSIQGQRYDASGNTVGGEFQINTYTAAGQEFPSVSLDADGDFVVVWHSYGSAGSDTSNSSIQGQRYDASGSTVGSEFQVNSYTTGNQRLPSVSLDVDGDFVVAWESDGSAGSDTSGSSIQNSRCVVPTPTPTPATPTPATPTPATPTPATPTPPTPTIATPTPATPTPATPTPPTPTPATPTAATPTATPTPPTPTPEPGVLLQLIAGGAGLAALNKRRMRAMAGSDVFKASEP